MCSIYTYIYHISPSTHCAASHDASKNQLHIFYSSFFYPHLRRGLSVLQKPVDTELATSLAKNQGEAHQDLQKIQDNLKKNLELKPWTANLKLGAFKKKTRKTMFFWPQNSQLTCKSNGNWKLHTSSAFPPSDATLKLGNNETLRATMNLLDL